MKVEAIKTKKIKPGDNLFDILFKSIKKLPEKSIVVITSKVVGICEGRIVSIDEEKKEELIKKEAYLYIPSSRNKYHIVLSIKNKSLVSSAGVDESNGGGYFVLWPKNPQKSANSIREMLSKKYKVKNLGVMITDSKSIPLRRGAVGTAIAHSGFSAVKNYIGKKDVFGRKFKVQKSNVLENLAGASVAVMGEGSEQTPIAIISDIGFVKFKKGNPSQKELSENYVKFEDDLFYELFNNKLWVKGKGL